MEFYRQPRAGRTHDTVEVVRTETLMLPMGAVDTYVIETTSKVVSGSWTGKATVWYAPPPAVTSRSRRPTGYPWRVC